MSFSLSPQYKIAIVSMISLCLWGGNIFSACTAENDASLVEAVTRLSEMGALEDETVCTLPLLDEITREDAARIFSYYGATHWCLDEHTDKACEFTDIDDVKDEIYARYACKMGLMSGNGSRFSPAEYITRAEFLAALLRTKWTAEGTVNLINEEVDPWYTHYYSHAWVLGLIDYEALSDMEIDITREEALQMISSVRSGVACEEASAFVCELDQQLITKFTYEDGAVVDTPDIVLQGLGKNDEARILINNDIELLPGVSLFSIPMTLQKGPNEITYRIFDTTDPCTYELTGSLTITYNTNCGNGYIDKGESCDDGNSDPTDYCTNTCEWPACGDGIIHRNESCDDGNISPWDGCDETCSISEGYTCVGMPSTCIGGGENAGTISTTVERIQRTYESLEKSQALETVPTLPLYLQEHDKVIQKGLALIEKVETINKKKVLEIMLEKLYLVKGNREISRDVYVILRYIEDVLVRRWYTA